MIISKLPGLYKQKVKKENVTDVIYKTEDLLTKC